jgi:hypothetical protein
MSVPRLTTTKRANRLTHTTHNCSTALNSRTSAKGEPVVRFFQTTKSRQGRHGQVRRQENKKILDDDDGLLARANHSDDIEKTQNKTGGFRAAARILSRCHDNHIVLL